MRMPVPASNRENRDMRMHDMDRDGQAIPKTDASIAEQKRLKYQDSSTAAKNASSGVRKSCPDCGELLMRIPRRLIDRLTSLFAPIRRYQCRSQRCQWRGNIAAQMTAGDKYRKE